MSDRPGTPAAYGLEADHSADVRPTAAGLAHHDEDGANDHLASIYERPEDQFATVVPFLRQGLERGERCVYVADDNPREAVLDALRDGGVDVDAALDSGALSIDTKADTYLRTGEFDRDAMIEFWRDSLSRARDVEGYDGLRAAAEMTWALDEGTSFDRLVGYESLLNTIYAGEDYAVLCQYSRDRFPADVLSDVVRSHPLVAYDGTVHRNDRYDGPAGFLDDDGTTLDVDRVIDGLSGGERTRRTLDDRERRLASLAEVTGDLVDARPREVCDRTVEVASDSLADVVAAVWRYDDAENDLRLRAASGPALERDGLGTDRLVDLAWDALTGAEPVVHGGLGEALGTRDGGADGAGLFVPLDRHGVFMVARPRGDGFEAADRDLVESLAGAATVALERADRERMLRKRERELERTTSALRRLEEIEAIVRDVDRALVRAETRDGIERAVCERLTAEDRFTFAWMGDHDPPGERLVPAEWAGGQRGYLEDVSLSVDAGDDREPSVRSARTGEVVVASNVIDDLDAGGWAGRALAAGFHSVASIPLSYDDVQYGVLSLYAGESTAFDGRLESVLGDLGDTVGYAINATRRKEALLTDEVTELEFEIRDPGCPILAVAREAACPIELRDVLARPSDGVLALVAVPAAALDRVLAAVADSTVVEDARPVAETDDGWLVQLTASTSLIAEDLADHGARLRELRADADSVCVSVGAPAAHPQAIVEMMRTAYPGAELLARRTERETEPPPDDATRFLDELTDRQREVAQLAYYGGYFERPREHTGEELAERLDVSPQAFHKHLRRIQRTLFGTTVADDPPETG